MSISNWWKNFNFGLLRETVKYKWKQEERILLLMELDMSFPDTLNEIIKIFKKSPNLNLHRYPAFRAWYKYHKDWEKEDQDFYKKLSAAGMLPHEEDPYYDPEAPDWLKFHVPYYLREDWHGDDDDEDDDDDDDFYDDTPNLKKAAKDGFMMGVGFGLVNSILNGK